jgi:hypothetical protein
VGIVALTYIVIQRSVITLDMTRDNRFTLTDASRAVLRRIPRPIQITGFYTARALPQREIDDQFFRLYEVETNGLISRHYINPDEQPALKTSFGATEDASIFISYLKPDGNVDFDTLARVPRGPIGQERDITGAIARMLISGTIRVYFETGHNSLSLEDSSQQGLSGIRNGLGESGIAISLFNLIELAKTGVSIPKDAAAVVMVRPTTDLSDAEIAILDSYLKSGGALFLMADATFNDNPFLKQAGAFNQYLWNNFGVRALDAVIVDPASSGKTALDIASAAVSGATPMGERLEQQALQTVFSISRAVEINPNPPPNVPNGWVVKSSPQSFGETNFQALRETETYRYDEGQDVRGPLASVVWAWNQQTNAKILLMGDGEFVTNGQVLAGGNSVLFTDSISWLTSFGERINYAPKAFSTVPLMFVSTQMLDLLAFITIILIPGIVLLTGLVIWTRRVRQ